MSPPRPVQPIGLPVPSGYSHGMRASGELLFVAGQVGWDGQGRLVSGDFVAQFAQALDNVLAVLRAAGGPPNALARLVIYVTDKQEYRRRRRELGEAWQARLGRNYPAITLVEVRSLLEDGALVEMEGVAVL